MSDPRSDYKRPAPFVGSDFPPQEFEVVRQLLAERTGFDLGVYKDRCVKRRIARRIRELGLADAGRYVVRLRDDPAEAEALLAALTIHVSQFFRNPSTFAALREKILPQLLETANREGRRELRLWSVGCAGGEEPYSLALLIGALDFGTVEVNILGTDINPEILQRAREGLYDEMRLAELPPEMRQRDFVAEGKHFRLREEVRRRVRYLRHDILNAPDCPRADLVLCRNVLIYFSREDQERIFERLADAIPPGGFLVLGRAETLAGTVRGRFDIACPNERIYRRR